MTCSTKKEAKNSATLCLRCSGFTLIELLVVIAMIAILAALLLPGLNAARTKADGVVCKSNLHQWTVGLNMYVNDFKIYPPTGMSDVQHGNHLFWYDRLAPYTAQQARYLDAAAPAAPHKTIYLCPSYIRLGGRPEGPGTASYGYNGQGYNISADGGHELGLGGVSLTPWPLDDTSDGPQDVRLIRESEVICPGDMIAIGDTLLVCTDPSQAPYKFWGDIDLSMATCTPAIRSLELGVPPILRDPDFVRSLMWMHMRHTGLWNIGFCDAHVENFKIKQLLDYHPDSVLMRWNRDHRPHRESMVGWP